MHDEKPFGPQIFPEWDCLQAVCHYLALSVKSVLIPDSAVGFLSMPGLHIYNDHYGAAGVFNFASHGILGTPCVLQWGYPVTSRLIGEI